MKTGFACHGYAHNMLRAGVAIGALGGAAFANAGMPAFVQQGKAGFVVTHIQYALSEKDAKETDACPSGMNQGIKRPDTAQSKDPEAERRLFAELQKKNACGNPQDSEPDPAYHGVTGGEKIAVYGVNMDGKDSNLGDKPAPGQCSHENFLGVNGERGIDNQFYRVIGCGNSFQSTGQSNTFEIEMYTGAWGILITLSGVDDLINDKDVEVGFYANSDPIELSPAREPLPNATYAIDQDPRFQARTHGRIINGVLTTDPANMRFHMVTNSIYLERVLNDARVQMTLGADGALEGYLFGYTPIEDMYDLQFGFRNGKNAAGAPASPQLIQHSANGAAYVLNYSCTGMYHGLQQFADADRDPATGNCTSISTQYRIKAIPAFVTDAKTVSVNEDLKGK